MVLALEWTRWAQWCGKMSRVALFKDEFDERREDCEEEEEEEEDMARKNMEAPETSARANEYWPVE